MANSRSRKSAPTRPGTSRDQRPKTTATGSKSRAADAAEDPTESTEDEGTPEAPAAKTTSKTAAAKAPVDKPAATAKATAAKATATKAAAKPAGKKATSAKAAAGSSGKRFGEGAATGGPRKGTGGAKSGGRGGSGGRPAPPVRIGQPKPWGMIAATLAVLLFAGAAIGYAVYQANSVALPESAEGIEGVTVAEYAPGQQHGPTDQTYAETPPVGGPHDFVWADCDGAIYDQQVRSENAVHSLEHGAVWVTYNPDEISDDDLSALTGYVQNQPYIFMSPFSGLDSPISLQSWNHQLFVDAVDDPRISQFIQLLRQNPEKYPEVGASCSQPAFLIDPIIDGEQSRNPQGGPISTDAPSTP